MTENLLKSRILKIDCGDCPTNAVTQQQTRILQREKKERHLCGTRTDKQFSQTQSDIDTQNDHDHTHNYLQAGYDIHIPPTNVTTHNSFAAHQKSDESLSLHIEVDDEYENSVNNCCNLLTSRMILCNISVFSLINNIVLHNLPILYIVGFDFVMQ